MNGDRPTSVQAVIVTYGNRGTFLALTLQALSGATRVVDGVTLVLNGACSPHTREVIVAACASGLPINMVELPRNVGSAAGFAAGLRNGVMTGREHMWLLDDDNAPHVDCLERLLAASAALSRTAVAAYRPPQYASLRLDREGRQVVLWSNFLGLHWRLILDRLLSRFVKQTEPWLKPPKVAKLAVAPYGGLLLPAAAVRRAGLPDERFHLYGDDTEYTARLVRLLGPIHLLTAALIDDVDQSWNDKAVPASGINRLLDYGQDFQVFYTVRNNAFLSRHVWRRGRLSYAFHRLCFMTLLSLAAAAKRNRRQRWRLVREAIYDGERGVLGSKEGLALP
jgi:GT2 family glycosyltransferase